MAASPRKSSGAVSKKSKKDKKGGKKPKKSSKKKKTGSKKIRFHAGTVALREIRKLQKGSQLLIQKAPFQRLVRETLSSHKTGIAFKPSALAAMQEAAESYLVGLFEGAVILQLHRGKKTLTNKDLNYTRRIRGDL